MALVDIILPTYNRAAVLPETLRSVQAQTFSDWRCFIAEDGETAATRAAVEPFLEDSRFVYLPGTHAGFPAAPRNRAIKQGAAPFIAFLDDDDLWLPEKLEQQVFFLQQHPACVLLGTNAFRWSGAGPADTSTPFFLKNLPAGRIAFEIFVEDNIIINSTALIRRSVLDRSGLLNEDPRLALCEDYELWLRIAALGEVRVLEKELAIYRDAPQSSIRDGLTPYRYLKKLELVFSAALQGNQTQSPLAGETGKPLALLCRKQQAKLRRQKREQLLLLARRAFRKNTKSAIIASGRLLGKLAGFFMNLDRSRPTIFMIFPYYHTGGAERVHADIISCLRGYRPWVIVARKSKNKAFKKAFSQGGRMIDLSLLCERSPSRVLSLFMMEFLTQAINSAANAVVFGCNSLFFYNLLPLLSESVKKIDLIHAFDGLEKYSLPYVPLLDARVGITKKVLDDLGALYQENSIDAAYLKRVRIIKNRTEVPQEYQLKPLAPPTVLYVGRGTVEKRVHLVGKIANRCVSAHPGMRFILAGDMCGSIHPEDLNSCVLKGEIFDLGILQDFYQQAHLLILTSKREGMPLVIMEAMSYGVVPIATDVGAIGTYIESGKNGYLVTEGDEEAIVEAFVQKIQELFSRRELYALLSQNAHLYALHNFTNDNFCSSYTELLIAPKSKEQCL